MNKKKIYKISAIIGIGITLSLLACVIYWNYSLQTLLLTRENNFKRRLNTEGIQIIKAEINAEISIDPRDSEQFISYAKETGIVYEPLIGAFGYKPLYVFHDNIAYYYYPTRYRGEL